MIESPNIAQYIESHSLRVWVTGFYEGLSLGQLHSTITRKKAMVRATPATEDRQGYHLGLYVRLGKWLELSKENDKKLMTHFIPFFGRWTCPKITVLSCTAITCLSSYVTIGLSSYVTISSPCHATPGFNPYQESTCQFGPLETEGVCFCADAAFTFLRAWGLATYSSITAVFYISILCMRLTEKNL